MACARARIRFFPLSTLFPFNWPSGLVRVCAWANKTTHAYLHVLSISRVEIDNKQKCWGWGGTEWHDSMKHCWVNIETIIIVRWNATQRGRSSFKMQSLHQKHCKWAFNALKRHRWDSAAIKMKHFGCHSINIATNVRRASFIDSLSEVYILFTLFYFLCMCALLIHAFSPSLIPSCLQSHAHSSGALRKMQSNYKQFESIQAVFRILYDNDIHIYNRCRLYIGKSVSENMYHSLEDPF